MSHVGAMTVSREIHYMTREEADLSYGSPLSHQAAVFREVAFVSFSDPFPRGGL